MKKTKSLQSLVNKQCIACRKGDPILEEEQLAEFLKVLDTWQLSDDKTLINRRFMLSNFEKTMKFVNQIAIIAEKNDHHPDVCFGYNYCRVDYTTHAIEGLSENDFICAAQIETLFAEYN